MQDAHTFQITADRRHFIQGSFGQQAFSYRNPKICIVDSGSGIWEIDHLLYTVKAGDIVLLDSRKNRRFKSVSEEEGLTLIIIEFEHRFVLNRFFYRLFFQNDSQTNFIIPYNEKIAKLANDMLREQHERKVCFQIVLEAKLMEVLSLLARYSGIAPLEPGGPQSELYQVLAYIDENYTGKVSLGHAARMLHMSEANLSKRFAKYVGIGFAQYVMHKRIHRAIHLLKTESKTVLEIAEDCGFNNPASFYKAFKVLTRETPLYFRNMHEDNQV